MASHHPRKLRTLAAFELTFTRRAANMRLTHNMGLSGSSCFCLFPFVPFRLKHNVSETKVLPFSLSLRVCVCVCVNLVIEVRDVLQDVSAKTHPTVQTSKPVTICSPCSSPAILGACYCWTVVRATAEQSCVWWCPCSWAHRCCREGNRPLDPLQVQSQRLPTSMKTPTTPTKTHMITHGPLQAWHKHAIWLCRVIHEKVR